PWEIVQAQFYEKNDSHKVFVKSRTKSSFDRFFEHRLRNSKPIETRLRARRCAKVEFLSVFRAPSQKFKILATPDVLAHGKLYEYDFMKKHDGHKICTK
ncbi:hypothetical protein BHM03_00060128, partial [Ensete ventricosum]